MGARSSDKEVNALIDSLRKENQQLKKRNSSLAERLRKANEKLSSGVGSRRSSGGTARVKSRRPPSASKGPRRAVDSGDVEAVLGEIEGSSSTSPRIRELIRALRARLLSTEERMQKLHVQNNELRRRASEGPPRGTLKELSTGVNAGGDLISLQRELKDRDAQLVILRSRYDDLESKARAAAEIHERTVHMMEEGNRSIRDLRRKIQAVQHENENLRVHQQRAEELRAELQSVREESKLLEDRMTALCESPFINDAFEGQSRVRKLLKLEQTDRQQKLQINHLKETAKTHHAEILTLKHTNEQLVAQRESLLKDNSGMRLKLEQMTRGAGLLQEKMRLYSGEGGVDTSHLEQALTMVKRNSEKMGEVPFIQALKEEGMATVPGLKRKVQDLQLANLSSSRELERCERMLKAQTNINKDLNAEVTDLRKRLGASTNELETRLQELETVAAKRLRRVHTLEAQVKQLLYARKENGGDAVLFDPSSSLAGAVDDDAGSDVLSLAASEGDFGPGENLVEIWVVGAMLDSRKVDKGATTFVMCDFYDFETQTSPLLTGVSPEYNFAATYKVRVDDFFLRYLATERLTLELNQTRHTDFELLAQCTVPLRPLLLSKGRMHVKSAELISARDGSIIGTINVRVRMALPFPSSSSCTFANTPLSVNVSSS